MTTNITPAPGYLLAIPHINKTSTFKPVKETDGLDQLSEVLEVGDSIIDSEGIERKSFAKKGDIILHAYSNKEFEIDFTKYRFVHFTEIHGTYGSK